MTDGKAYMVVDVVADGRNRRGIWSRHATLAAAHAARGDSALKAVAVDDRGDKEATWEWGDVRLTGVRRDGTTYVIGK